MWHDLDFRQVINNQACTSLLKTISCMTTTWLIGHLGILIDFTTSPWQFPQPSIDKDLYDKDMTSSQQNKTFTSIKVLICTNLLMVWIFVVHERQKLPLMPWSYRNFGLSMAACNPWHTSCAFWQSVIRKGSTCYHLKALSVSCFWEDLMWLFTQNSLVLSSLSLISILNLGFVN